MQFFNLDIKSGKWVLLVDDSEQVATFYSRVAEALGLRYFTADSVDVAQDILKREGEPDLVITDIQLGSGSGLDLVRSIRSEFGDDMPVIVVSGHADSDIGEQVKRAGGTKFLHKPVGRRRLFAEITNVLGEDT